MSTVAWILLVWFALSAAAVTGYLFGVAVGRRQGLDAVYRARPQHEPRWTVRRHG